MRHEKLSKTFWSVFGISNVLAVLYVLALNPPETDDARMLAAAMSVGALLALGIVDLIAVSVASSYGGAKQRSLRQN